MDSTTFSRRQLMLGALATLTGAAFNPAIAQTPAPIRFRGVNLAGAEFGSRMPGVLNTDYIYPGNEHIDYYVDKGMNVFRLPFRWERLQRRLNGALSAVDIAEVDRIVKHATDRGAHVVLDPHNFGRREIGGTPFVIGETTRVSSSNFANFWARLATRYRANPKVIFGLMNEPYDQKTSVLVSVLNNAIRAIRGTGATNLILVPGNAWTGAHSWVSSGNAEAMLLIKDPGRNFAFDVHQYLDHDSSGTNHACTVGAGATRLVAFTDWARANGRRGFLGEFGITANQACESELSGLLGYVAQHGDVWLGWTYWAGGPWWGEEPFTVAPADIWSPVDRPQMAVLEGFL